MFLDKTQNKDLIEELNKIQDFFEILGIGRWTKGELTHLGFRAGTRYEEPVDVASDNAEESSVAEESAVEIIDEATLNAENKTTDKE